MILKIQIMQIIQIKLIVQIIDITLMIGNSVMKLMPSCWTSVSTPTNPHCDNQ